MTRNPIGSTRFGNPMCNWFFIIKDFDIAFYADGNRPYLRGKMLREF